MKLNNKKPLIIIGTIILLIMSGYVYFTFLYAYHGQVIDADTKQPIEGAVVVASWSEQQLSFTGGGTRFKDVKETITDKKGEWTIRGPRGGGLSRFLSLIPGIYHTHRPEFIVFKPGYCSLPAGFRIDSCKGKIKTYNFKNSESIGEIVELSRLAERRRDILLLNIPFIPFEGEEKIPFYESLLKQALAEERR